VLDHTGVWLVDGRNRQRACAEAGVEPRYVNLPEDVDLSAYVVSANLHRRHLTAEQKREFIGKLLAMDPERSDRGIAQQVKVDHKTVAAVRSDKEDRGEIPHTETRRDASGRAQPAHKPPPAIAHEATSSGEVVTFPAPADVCEARPLRLLHRSALLGAERAKREEEAELNAEWEAREEKTLELARLIVDRLGDARERFLALVGEVSMLEVGEKVLALLRTRRDGFISKSRGLKP
jgi:hypothetical protein